MRVGYIIFNAEPRSQIIRKGLMKNGVEVLEIHGTLRPWKVLSNLFKNEKYDVLIVGEYGQAFFLYTGLLKGIGRSTLLFDPYVSVYETYVYDRKLIDASSWKAKYYFLLDKYSCKFADICLLDTDEHIKYFEKTFGVKPSKFRKVYVGADDEIFYPRSIEKKDRYFTVFWYGTYIPLHGAEYIVKAAKILEKHKDIRFIMVGNGQMYFQTRKLAESLRISNIEFIEWVNYNDLPVYMSSSNVCLGIFGNTGKARRVIPNKVFQALAVRKPVITGNTPAVREALFHLENAYLCDIASPISIAEAILTLKEDKVLRKKLAENGYQLFKRKFSIEQIGKEVKGIIEESL